MKKLIAALLFVSTQAFADSQVAQIPPGACNVLTGVTTTWTFAEYTGYLVTANSNGMVIILHRCFDNATTCNQARNDLQGNAGVSFGLTIGAAAAGTLSIGRINGVCYEEAN